MGAESQVPTGPVRLTQHLAQRVKVGLGQSPQIVAPTLAVEGGQHLHAADVDRRHAVLEDGIHQTLFGPEVVAGGGRIALAGLSADLPERDRADPPLGEEALGHFDHAEAGLGPVVHAQSITHVG